MPRVVLSFRPSCSWSAAKIDDPNHLRGTKSDTKPAGYRGTGTVTSTLTWDLARQGSAR